MTLEKFSKPSVAVIKNKTSFFEENEKHLKHVKSVNEFYKTQPIRKKCKTCEHPIDGIDLIIHNVPYNLCEKCNHLNGLHEDTNEFANFLYSDSDGDKYSKNYLKDFEARVKDIYLPKANFLKEVVGLDNVKDFSVTDVGCGGGHFVKACEDIGINAIGYDVNKTLIDLGSSMLEVNNIEYKDLDMINEIIQETKTNVLSLVGVLEHLMDPVGALNAFNLSKAKYLYLQVPLFSFAALQESMHNDVFPRQLNAGHTHLYTNESIDFLCKKFGFERAGEWWFGTDIVDLFRHFHIKVNFTSDSKSSILQKYLGDHIDEMQRSLDKRKMCSGVNMVLRKSS